MKRKFGFLLGLSILGLLFTACGPAKEKVTEIKVWTKDRHDQEFMMAIVEELNNEYKDMKVVYEMYTDNYPQVIEIAAGTGELPDIICLSEVVIEPILARNMVTYIDDLMPADVKARFDKGMFVEGINMHNGKIFTLPNTGTTLRLVYNKDIFKRAGLSGPPKSIDEMVAYAQKISKELSGEGIYGFALPLKNPTSGLRRGITLIPQLSGYPVDEGFDFAQGKYDFSSYKPVIQALEKIWSSGAAFPGCESLDIDPLRTQFSAGKIGMYMTYNHSEWGVYTSQFPTTQDWGYAVLPTYTGTITGSQRLTSGFWYAITTNCKEPEKAWRVLEKFYDKANQVSYYEKGLGVTVMPDVMAAAKTPESVAYVPAMGIQPTDKIWPLKPKQFTVEGDEWGPVFGALIFGNRKDIDSAITDLNRRYNAGYEKSVSDGMNAKIHYPSFKANDPAGTAK